MLMNLMYYILEGVECFLQNVLGFGAKFFFKGETSRSGYFSIFIEFWESFDWDLLEVIWIILYVD